MSDITRTAGLAEASVRRRRRLPAIWIIPILAIGIAAWLGWRTVSEEGPTITVSFESAEGLQAGQSQLKFKDVTLGTVKKVALNSDNTRVIVTIATTREADALLTDQTIFWVVKPRLFAGTVSGLSTLLSGSFVGMLPGKAAGHAQYDFVGREDPPVLESDVPGHTFLVRADRVGSLSLGSPVFFRDLTVGEVLGWDLADMAQFATVHVFVRSPFDQYVNDSTRFWNASGLSVKLGSDGVNVQMESLKAVLLGGIAFDTPKPKASREQALANEVFPLYANQEAADSAEYTRRFPLVAYFAGSVRGLSAGASVTFLGLKIGRVTGVDLIYDPKADDIRAPVRFEVEPERILGLGKQVYATPQEGLDALLKRGLRASLQSANLITGQKLVALEFGTEQPDATVKVENGDFVIPAAPGSGLDGLQAAATDLLAKLNSIPFEQIGKSLAGTLQGAENIANGPQLKQAVASLSDTLTIAKQTLQAINNGVGPAMKGLPEITEKLQSTLTDVNKLVMSLESGYGDNTKFNLDLERLLVQLNSTAQSFRALSDLLQRHPEALIRGRTDTGVQ